MLHLPGTLHEDCFSLALLSMDFSQNFPELALTATGDTFLEPGHILAVGSQAEVFLMTCSGNFKVILNFKLGSFVHKERLS